MRKNLQSAKLVDGNKHVEALDFRRIPIIIKWTALGCILAVPFIVYFNFSVTEWAQRWHH